MFVTLMWVCLTLSRASDYHDCDLQPWLTHCHSEEVDSVYPDNQVLNLDPIQTQDSSLPLSKLSPIGSTSQVSKGVYIQSID